MMSESERASYVFWTDDSGVVSLEKVQQCSKCGAILPTKEFAAHRNKCVAISTTSASTLVHPDSTSRWRSEKKVVRKQNNLSFKEPIRAQRDSGHFLSGFKELVQSLPSVAKVGINRIKKHVTKLFTQSISPQTATDISLLPLPETVKIAPESSQKISTIPLVSCPKCKVSVKENRLVRHLQRVHPDYYFTSYKDIDDHVSATSSVSSVKDSQMNMVMCPKCKVFVRDNRLQRHMNKVHKKVKLEKRARPDYLGRPTAKMDNDNSQAFWQSFDEEQDGSKYWGHMRRENGRFGSHPIFDDYGEESKP